MEASTEDGIVRELSRRFGDLTVRAFDNGLVAVQWTQEGRRRVAEGYALHTALRRAQRASRAQSGQPRGRVA